MAMHRWLWAALFVIAMPVAAGAAVVQLDDFADFTTDTITSDVGSGIISSPNFSSNGFNGTSAGAPGLLVVAPNAPLVIEDFTATEVGIIFGNDQNDPMAGSDGIFDVTLTVFDGATNLGSVTVVSNGNDIADQFIGVASMTPFSRIELDYGPDAGFLARFVARVDLGLNAPPIPLPAALPMLLTGLAGFGALALRRRRAPR